MGQRMSASVTVRPSITKPPEVMRLATTNSSTNCRKAGPGQATKPSPPRKRRLASRCSSASRSCSLLRKSTSWAASFLTLRSLNPVLVKSPGRPSTRDKGPAKA